jgi:hypothetical protein
MNTLDHHIIPRAKDALYFLRKKKLNEDRIKDDKKIRTRRYLWIKSAMGTERVI